MVSSLGGDVGGGVGLLGLGCCMVLCLNVMFCMILFELCVFVLFGVGVVMLCGCDLLCCFVVVVLVVMCCYLRLMLCY